MGQSLNKLYSYSALAVMPKGPYYSLITFMPRTPSMTIDRVIDGESRLYVGITSPSDNINPLNGQCMRFGDDDLKRMVNFVETNNTLEYFFENDNYMKFTKGADNVVTLTMRYNDITTTREINPMMRRFYKPISCQSAELDKLSQLFS